MPKFIVPSKSTLAGAAIIVGVGLAFSAFRVGQPLARLSYDLGFRFSKAFAPSEAVMVTIDEESRKELGLPSGRPIPRTLQTKLLERLTRDGARIVFYDLIFDQPGDDPAADEAFAAAMRKHGNVVLSGLYETPDRERAGAEVAIVTPPARIFRGAAKAWGLAGPLLLDPDNSVRRIGVPRTEEALAHWRVAELLDSPSTKKPENKDTIRWLNYYGPAGTIPWCTFSEALDERMRPSDFFRGKIVCIGGKPSPVGRKFGEDEFGYPYSRWGYPFMIGLEIHTTALLNLIRSEWLDRLAMPLEMVIVVLAGLAATAASYGLSPRRGLLTLGAAAAALAIAAFALQTYGHVWWNWLVPVGVEIPLSAVCSVSTLYFAEVRRRAQLRQAFSLYLSPEMADRIAEEEFDLKPGGKLVEATVLFTDCKDFTAMSEELKDAQRISETLIAYFTETSKHVLENDGTILKYIGDAVFACWNAPISEPDHAAKAARAAWAIHDSGKQMVMGRMLNTRVGVCTGEVVAGNLGSPYRFDYSAIGETVNFASRLEGLNKYLGTNILIADSTRRGLGDRFVVRSLGNFVVAGKTSAVAIHELIAPIENKPADLAWLGTWDDAMKALRQGDFAVLQKALREVVWQRGGKDGPSEFYLKYLARLEKDDQLREWTGIVKLSEK